MRICFLMYQGNMYSGGQGVYLHYLTRELARMGHDVHVIAGPPYPTLAEGVTAHNIRDYSYWTYHHYKKDFVFNRPPLSYFHPVNFYEFISTRIDALVAARELQRARVLQAARAVARAPLRHRPRQPDAELRRLGRCTRRGFPLVATIHHPLTYDLRNALRQSRSDVREGAPHPLVAVDDAGVGARSPSTA